MGYGTCSNTLIRPRTILLLLVVTTVIIIVSDKIKPAVMLNFKNKLRNIIVGSPLQVSYQVYAGAVLLPDEI